MADRYRLPSWQELHEWASSKPDDATVGFSRDMFLGPLNLYFAETVRGAQGKYWMIGHASMFVLVWDMPRKYQEMYQKVCETPVWIHDLMEWYDRLADEEHPSPISKGYVVMGSLRPITAAMFKQAMERVKEKVV